MSNTIYNVFYSIIICIVYSLANKYLATKHILDRKIEQVGQVFVF